MDDLIDGLRPVLQLAGPDTILLVAPAGLVVGLLVLGLSGNLRRARWMPRLGWLIVALSVAALVYSMVGSGSTSPHQ